MLPLFLLLCNTGTGAMINTEKSLDDSETKIRHKLTSDLLKYYDRQRVPTRGSEIPVNVSITLWPYDILYLNEARSSIKVSGWFDMRWVDYFFIWNPKDYGNITHTHLPVSKVWLPTVDIYYSKEDSTHSVQICPECYVKIDSNGSVLYGRYFVYSFPCHINVKYFPFDQQTCEMELANWHLDDKMMDLYPTVNEGNAVDLSVFLPNEEWELLEVTAVRRRAFFNYGYFPSLGYKFHIKRKPFFYVCNLVIPSLIITITAVVGYHLPSTGSGIHQEKVKMGLTTILSIFILQLGVSDKMPRTTDVIPLINIYYSSMVIILSLAIVSTGLVILIEKQGIYGKPVPIFLQRWLLLRNCHHGLNTHLYCNNKSNHNSAAKEKLVMCNGGGGQGRRCSSMNHRRQSGNQINAFGYKSSTMSIYDNLCECTSAAATTAPPPTVADPRGENCGSGWNWPQPDPSCNNTTTTTGLSYKCRSSKDNGATIRPRTISGTTIQPVDPKSRKFSPSCANCDITGRLLAESLLLIHVSLSSLTESLSDTKLKNKIKRDWSTLADVVERMSLFLFTSAAFIALTMFFYHGWY